MPRKAKPVVCNKVAYIPLLEIAFCSIWYFDIAMYDKLKLCFMTRLTLPGNLYQQLKMIIYTHFISCIFF